MTVSFRTIVVACSVAFAFVDGFMAPIKSSRQSLALNYDDFKDSDRAHIERNLEAAMNNDWRMFRAKLVAQENKQGRRLNSMSSASTSSTHGFRRGGRTLIKPDSPVQQRSTSSYQRNWHSSRYSNEQNEDAIPVMPPPDTGYQRNWHNNRYCDNFEEPVQPNEPWNSFPVRSPPPVTETRTFAGSDQLKPRNGQTSSDDRLDRIDNDKVVSEDPFVSNEELPILFQETVIDKHRWAHEIPTIEPGNVLIAGEKLEGVFRRAVVLVTQHSETTGTYGVVINRPLDGGLMAISSGGSAKVDLSQRMAFRDSTVTFGGPVESEEFAVIHSFGEVDGSRKLCPGVYVGGSRELMTQVRRGSMDPKTALFAKGHVAWVPGQLQQELQQGIWYMASVSPDFILRHAGGEKDNESGLWEDILTCMGGYFEDIVRRSNGGGGRSGTGDLGKLRP